jgi:hypothetical protein
VQSASPTAGPVETVAKLAYEACECAGETRRGGGRAVHFKIAKASPHKPHTPHTPTLARTCNHAPLSECEYCHAPIPPVQPSCSCACPTQTPNVDAATQPEPASEVASGFRTMM